MAMDFKDLKKQALKAADKAKDAAGDLADEARKRASEVDVDKLKSQAVDAASKAKEAAKNIDVDKLKDQATDLAKDAKKAAKNLDADDLKKKGKKLAEEATDAVEGTAKDVKKGGAGAIFKSKRNMAVAACLVGGLYFVFSGGGNESNKTSSSYSRLDNIVAIKSVSGDSNAEDIGLKKDDIIVSYGGKSITSMKQFVSLFKASKEEKEVIIYRDGDIETFDVPEGKIGVELYNVKLTDEEIQEKRMIKIKDWPANKCFEVVSSNFIFGKTILCRNGKESLITEKNGKYKTILSTVGNSDFSVVARNECECY